MRTVWKLVALLVVVAPLMAQEKVDWEMMSRIRYEALNHSQALDVLSHLTDKIGPRLTNSPNMRTANEYTRTTLEGWGLENAHLESWGPFGRGWSYSHSSVHMNSPRKTTLIAIPSAWTPGTNGPVTGEAVLLKVESEEDLEKYKGTLAGKIVFLSEVRPYEHDMDADFLRYTDTELEDMCMLEVEEHRRGRGGNWRKRYQLRKLITPFLREEGALASISISSRDDGIITVSGGGSYDVDGEVGITKLVMAAEHYNQVARKLEDGEKVELTVNVTAQFHDEDLMAQNTIAEIPGTDLKDQVVMAGAHLDSWHGGTGAVDNGAGVVMVMEAMRILKALDVKPRRTIRIGLWSGEEQGLLGSVAYVEAHLADFIVPEESKGETSAYMRRRNAKVSPKAGHEKFSAYFNLDNGGGKIRGIYTQGNVAVNPIFEAWQKPFADMGAGWVTNNNTGGTDHQSFDRAGLPGFQFIQDPLSYNSKNHHTHLDVLDHVVEADLKQAAAVLAGFIYQTAMRDELIPRKPIANLYVKEGKKEDKKLAKKGKKKDRAAK